MLSRLLGGVPPDATAQKDFFEPDLSGVKKSDQKYYTENASLLRKLLVHRSPLMPAGLLKFCLKYAGGSSDPIPGIFTLVRKAFVEGDRSEVLVLVDGYYDFRNAYIAHEKKELTDAAVTREALQLWVNTLRALHAQIQ